MEEAGGLREENMIRLSKAFPAGDFVQGIYIDDNGLIEMAPPGAETSDQVKHVIACIKEGYDRDGSPRSWRRR